LEDPFYEPRDCLLLKRANRTVAHVHLTHRVMQFGPVQIPLAGLKWLATADDCRGQGLGSHLLVAAEKQAAQDGALVGLLRTNIPHFFRRTGWALCGQPCCSLANTHTVLARLLDEGLRRHRHHARLHIRPWRRWEEAALLRIYRQNLSGRYGPLDRTPAYWQWLLRRQAYDRIYVALDGPDLWDLDETSTSIVGYAVLKGERVVELLTAPRRHKAAIELLAHACGDAIEHDHHSIVLHAPPDNPLHAAFAPCHEAGGGMSGGGAVSKAESACHYMARLLDPMQLLRRLCGEFGRRAEAARLPRPLELGLQVEGQKYQLELGVRGVEVVSQRMGRSYLRLNVADFTRLVLGQLDWDRAVAEKRLEASTSLAQQAGRALFPRLPLWYPPLDELVE
jgi:GNAT superfamily N-acetyltransferase